MMSPLFKKLNFKDQDAILVMDAPDSFRPEMDGIAELAAVHEDAEGLKGLQFAMAFVTKKVRVDELAPLLDAALEGDAMLWLCYPKGSSKKYTCDFNRDNGWNVVGEAGWEGVRMVAIDADWSALRFRRVEYIKKMTRSKSFAMTKAGKSKTSGK
ncbi:MAG: hypothetical protein AAF570_07605 [Bacteroidota bacterium]